MPRILILVPTRNRSDLAERSARSALGQPADAAFKVVVSDNSDEAAESQTLAAALGAIADPRLALIRPPQPMKMGDHWDWAIQHCLDHFSPTHLIILTDRMTFRGQAVAELFDIATRDPDHLISYRSDRVNDLRQPVVLERVVYSGNVGLVQSRRLIDLASRCAFHFSIPRLLNAMTPATALLRVKATFGDYCRTVSPDFGFGYRYLATHAEFLYFDKAPIIQSAILRSNGASTARGVYSKDTVNFIAAGNILSQVPYPEVLTMGNGIMEEYCRVRNLPAFAALPPLEPRRYVKLLCSDVLAMEDPGRRRQFFSMLQQRGHRAASWWYRLRYQFKVKTRWIESALKRLVRGKAALPAPDLVFPTVDAALSWDEQHPPAPITSVWHLRVIDPRPLDSRRP